MFRFPINALRLWTPAAVGFLMLPRMMGAPVTALAFDQQGTVLFAAEQRAVRVVSAETGSFERSLELDYPKILDLAISPVHPDLLAVAGGAPGSQGGVTLFNWRKNELSARQHPHSDVATAASFSPDGTRLAVSSADQSVLIWEIQRQGAHIARGFSLTGHSGPVRDVQFSPDGRLLVTAGSDRSLKVWDSRTGNLLRSLGNHTGVVHCLAFQPDLDSLSENGVAIPICASGSADQTVRIWQPATGRMVRIIRGHEGAILALAYAPSGNRLFSAGGEGTVRIIDAESDQILHQWQAHDDWIYALAVHPQGTSIASADWNGDVKLWDLTNIQDAPAKHDGPPDCLWAIPQ